MLCNELSNQTFLPRISTEYIQVKRILIMYSRHAFLLSLVMFWQIEIYRVMPLNISAAAAQSWQKRSFLLKHATDSMLRRMKSEVAPINVDLKRYCRSDILWVVWRVVFVYKIDKHFSLEIVCFLRCTCGRLQDIPDSSFLYVMTNEEVKNKIIPSQCSSL